MGRGFGCNYMNEQIPQNPQVAPAPVPQPQVQPQPQVVTPQKQGGGGNNALKIILILLLSCVVIVVLVLVVGGFLAKKAIETGGGKFGENLIENAIEKSTGENFDLSMNELPKDFPSDIPVYKAAKVQAAISAEGTADYGASYNVTLLTDDSLKAVIEYYDTELSSNGWTITDTYQFEGYSIGASKGTRDLLVIMQESEEGVTINLSVTEGGSY